jgi:hypothetical protein
LRRTLFLIRYLDACWMSQRELAEHFSVTTRTIRRDVAFLREHGFTIETRGADVSDSGCLSWRLTAWPERYDLTTSEGGEQASPA